MRYNAISYFISEGFRNTLKNKKSTFSCIGVMCATMLVFGLFFVIGENLDKLLTDIESSQGMQVFVTKDANEEEIEEFGEKLQQIEGVNTVKKKSKEEAYNEMKTRLGDKQELMDVFEPDIFTDSYMVTLTDLSLNDAVQAKIQELDHYRKITSSNSTINKLATIGEWIRNVTLVILVILIVISIFIISNTIKLTVHARRREISIMKYVGATNNFIRSPFVVEGIIIGLISGLLSLLLIGGLYNFISGEISKLEQIKDIGVNLLAFKDLFNEIIIVYIVLGIGIGVIGSVISMRKYLEV